MRLTRREFLQQSGLALAACGVSAAGWTTPDCYRQVLAAPTSRKLALLIGINQYSFSPGLEGCVTDVELQRELLIHRFGFRSSDVLTLTDWQATREAVETAFVEHLIGQAKAGDVVVFHFSGFGSTLTIDTNTGQTSLVMADAAPAGDVPIVNDLLEDTLWLLLRSLKTDRVTTVLDTSYVYLGSPLQGNLRVRSYPNPSGAQPAAAELAFQETLLERVGLDRSQLAARRSRSLPGLVLTAAEAEQVATEMRWNRFNAGLFTEALTRSLWQTTPATTVGRSLGQAVQQIEQFTGQQHPALSGQDSLKKQEAPPYFVSLPEVGADGVVTGFEESSGTVQLWLGGLSASVLEQYGVNSLLTLLPIDPSSVEPPLKLQITARDGFAAKAKVYNPPPEAVLPPIAVGQWVQEAVRVLPRHVGLTIALDGSLERIERVDAISALTSVPRISSAIAGEAADYLFSKLPSPQTQLAALPTTTLTEMVSPSPASSSYGLFSLGHDPILNTTGEGGEAIKVAVRRLMPKLQTLLAAKLLNLTVNNHTSRLSIRARLEMIAPQAQTLAYQETGRGAPFSPLVKAVVEQPAPLQLLIGSRVHYRIENANSQPIYPLAIALDSTHNLLWLHAPTTITAESDNTLTSMPPSSPFTLPTPEGADWQIQGSPGLAEVYLIFSRAPFEQTQAMLTTPQRSGSPTAGAAIANSLDVAQAILHDLSQAAQPPDPNTPDTYALEVSAWATFRFIYQVV